MQFPTSFQQRLFDAALAAFRGDSRIRGAWLSGSFAQGAGDQWSDIDLHCYAADDDLAGLERDWPDWLSAVTPTVHADQLGGAAAGSFGLVAITPEWEHLDVWFFARSSIESRLDWAGTYPLFDHDEVLPAEAVPAAQPGAPWFPRRAVETGLYVLGNLPVAVGRGEVLLLPSGVMALRDHCLVPLMHAERGLAPKGGLKRFSQHLTPEQADLLAQMPPIEMDMDALIQSHLWFARAFIPRGRALASKVGAEYPDAYERATLGHLERKLGLTL